MKRDLAYDKRMRMWARILFFVVTLLTPVVMVSYQYKFYESVSGYKLTVMGMVIIIVLFYRFRTEFINWVNAWEYSAFKHVLLGLNRVIIPILIYFIVKVAQSGLTDLLFLIEWIMVTSIIGYTIILPIEKHYDFYVKRELRKAEMREVRDE